MKRFLFCFFVFTLFLVPTATLVCKEPKQDLSLKVYTDKIDEINDKLSSQKQINAAQYDELRQEITDSIAALKTLKDQISERIEHSTPQEKKQLGQTLIKLDELYLVANNILKIIDKRKIQSSFQAYLQYKMPLYEPSSLVVAYKDGITVTKDITTRIYQSIINIAKKSISYPFYIYWLIWSVVVIAYIPSSIMLRNKIAPLDEKASYLNKIKTFIIHLATGSILPVLFIGGFFHISYISGSFLFPVDEIIAVYLVIAFIWITIHSTISLICPKDFRWALVHMDLKTAQKRSKRISLFLLFLALRLWLTQINNPPEFTQYLELSTQILLSIQAFFIINVTHFRKSIKTLLGILAVLCPLLMFVGYSSLSDLVLRGTLSTLIVYLIFRGISYTFKLGLYYAFKSSNSIFTDSESSLNNSDLIIYWIHMFINLFLFLLSTYAVLLSWGIDQVYLNSVVSGLLFGFTVGNHTISLINLFLSVTVFLFFYLLTKYAQNLLKNNVFPYTHFDAGLKHAVKATTGYIGITFAVILSVKTLGLNLSSLLYILGGLSVGIGLGLQPIVTNFISGIVMLIERPIKIGDSIEIGGETGIVKKINVRTTEIENFEKCSVLLPNSQVINVMVKKLDKK